MNHTPDPSFPSDRRTFLKNVSALGIGFMIAPALANAAAHDADRPKRYTLVGTGARNRLYLDALATDFRDTAHLVGLCDHNPGRLQLARDRVQKLGSFEPATCAPAELETMLAQTKTDVVIVTTVDATHDEYIIRAMNVGCDVISEKPLTTTPEKCQAIIDACARTGRSCRVIFNLRYSPTSLQVKELLASGEIGDILSVDFHWMLDTSHGADYFRRWHSHKVNSGGLMIHKSSHHFDLANWWLGAMPTSVYATGKREFYTPKMAQRLGLSGAHERCLTCPESSRCGFYLDLRANPDFKSLYLEQEHFDGYFRDRCVFRPEINIEDTMNVLVRYDTGATLAYSLNAFNAWEGYWIAFNGTRGRLEYHFGGPPGPQKQDNSEAIRITLTPLRGAAREITPVTGVGTHQGGDHTMLEDLFRPNRPVDKYHRAADHRAGTAAAIIGMAANRCFVTGQPVEISSLVTGLSAPDQAPMPSHDSILPMPIRNGI